MQNPGDSYWLLCRRTMVVTSSMAVFAPTTQGLCTVCAPCKPGEPLDQEWEETVGTGGRLPMVALTGCCLQSPVWLRPAVLLHSRWHTTPDC
jgi:hypothetical protein